MTIPTTTTAAQCLWTEAADPEARQRKWMERYEEAKDDASADLIWARLRELKTKQLAITEEIQALEARGGGERRRDVSAAEVFAALAKLPDFDGTPPQMTRAR